MPPKNDVRLEIRHLKLLAAIAEYGSVTEAARRLHVTQSALSHQLRDAEEKLGAPLFLRLGKKMVLTPAGAKLLDSARKVLEELHSAEMQIEGLNGTARGVVRVATECYTCYHWLPPVLKSFGVKYPRVEVNIELEATSNPVQALLDGKLDVAVISCRPPNKCIRLTPTCEDELVIVMSPKHRLASCTHVQPRDLEGETVFCYPPKEESTLIGKLLRPAGIEPERVMEVPLTESILELVSAGLGVSLLARWALNSHLSGGRVITRPVLQGGFRRQWYAATLRSQPMTPFLSEFVSLLARTCLADGAH